MTAVRDGGARLNDGTSALVRRRREPPCWEFGELTIRRYRHPDEFDAVLAMHRTGLAHVGLRPGDGIYYESDFFQMEELYLGPGGEFLVGEIAGELVAMGGLRSVGDSSQVGEMVRVRVRPRWQRRGFGAAMVAALEERATEMGYRCLRADTTVLQQPALALYRRVGWRETRREVVNGIGNVHLEKTLTEP